MRFEQTIRLSASQEAVWDLLADTDRLNREMGLPRIQFDFAPRKAGGTEATATVRAAGLTLKYREHPFDWIRPRFHTVRRTFFGGPIREVVGGVELSPVAGGTEARIWAEIEPRGAMGILPCRAFGVKSVGDCISACRRFEEYLSKRASTPYPRHSGRPPADEERLRRELALLRQAGANPALGERLAEFLRSAPPEDTVTIRPFALADSWAVNRRSLLETCLLAARTGMLELRWRVLCPYCRGGPPGTQHLRDLAAETHCDTCNIRFDADFDRRVEVCFSVAPRVRPVQATTYCIGGPMLSPHVVAQWTLAPGETRESTLEVSEGEYRLTSLQAESAVPVTLDERSSEPAEVRICPGETGAEITVAVASLPPAGTWRITNQTDETIVLRLETPEWTTDSATAAYVTSLQAFRDLFSAEVLSPGTELAVRHLCFLFSDLKGSTAMYREIGDAASYRTVRDHFAFMRRVIEAHSGGVLKTAGDAVMATFTDPADALAAALEVQREAAKEPSGLQIKLGLHIGPAIAVNANDALDYFGEAVNVAARLQNESLGGDVVISGEVAADPRAAALLTDSGIASESFEAPIRGLEIQMRMIRLRLR